VEAKVNDEAKMKKLMKIVPDDEVAIDDILLATKSLQSLLTGKSSKKERWDTFKS
ncbi:hypothetical protein Tco_0644523, partial [Tanacetum coccineum]